MAQRVTQVHEHKIISYQSTVDYAAALAKCVPPGRLLTYEDCSHLYENLADQLSYYRMRRHLTQAEVAALLEISRQAYCNYENNQRKPDLVTLLRLSRLYHVSLDQLILRKI